MANSTKSNLYSLKVIGGVRLTGAQGEIRLQKRMAALLAYLALEGPVPKYRLAGMLWPDSPEPTARNNLRQALKRLREAAGEELVEGEDSIAISERLEVDATVLSTSAFAGEHAKAASFEGDLLEGLDFDDCPEFDEWLIATREQLSYLRRDAASAEAERLEDAGRIPEALEYARRALEFEPVSEEAHRRVMRLHYLQGDRGAALAAYERCREILRREFGAQPLPETQALAGEIERGQRIAQHKVSKTSIPLAVSRPPLLVGREREWAIMEEAWERGQTIYLVGEAGSGKTRLAQDFVASKGPGLYLPARPGSREIPFGVAASLLRLRLAAAPQVSLPEWVRRELSRILPELHPQGPLPLGEEDRLRFYQAYFEAVRLSGAGFVASISDDAHYYDQATVDLGAFMMSQPVPPNAKGIPRYLVIYRKEEMTPSSQAVIDGLVRSGVAVRIDLEPLPLEQVQELLEEFEIPGMAELAQPIQRFTGGNPQFVLETLRHLIETGQLERGWPGRLPPPGKIKQVITGRLEKLSPLALNLARAAAVLGSEVSVERVAQVMEASPLSLAPAWEELEAAQVLQGMAFSHDSLYETTLSAMPQSIKGYLHRQSAAVLEQAQAHPAMIAAHWLEGGEALRAAPHLLRAAQEADFASRVSEAVAFAERAMTIYQQQGLQDREFEALWWLGRMLQARGDNPRLDQVSQHLLALARTSQQRARALDHRAFLLYRVGRLEESLELAQQAYPLAVEAEDLYCQTELKQIEAQVYYPAGPGERGRCRPGSL